MKEGDRVNIVAAIDGLWMKETNKNNKPFTKMMLRTKEQETYDSVHWGKHWTDLKTGMVIEIEATVEVYRDDFQLKVWKYKESKETPESFLPRVPDDEHKENKLVIKECLDRIINPALKSFATFCMKDAGRDFLWSTGAIRNHHAIVRGLLKHTAEMVRISERLVEMYIDVELDRDLVWAALPLHDWGKMEEYSVQGASFGMTDRGKMLSHPGITPVRLAELRARYNADAEHELDDDLFFELLHTIMAHHGKVEYNAPSGPKTLPALVVHMADYCSCFGDAFKQACKGGERGEWSRDRIVTPDYYKNVRRSGE